MYVPSLKDKISELLARRIGFAADAIMREYGLGQLKSLEDTLDAISYANLPVSFRVLKCLCIGRSIFAFFFKKSHFLISNR
jgi:hypothetical protein